MMKKKKGLNCKVVIRETNEPLRKGQILEIKDGKFHDGIGTYPAGQQILESIEDLNCYFAPAMQRGRYRASIKSSYSREGIKFDIVEG